MPKTYRLGVIGFAHMHVNELMRVFAELPNVELVEARFTRDWNKRHAHEEIGIPQVYDDYREMLDKERFDLVLFCPENARHGEVAEAIAAHGAHIVTEKPMAASQPEALRMARAARAAGVMLAVNWPTTWSAPVRTAYRLVREGAIGQLWEVKWRAGSMGPLSRGSTHPGVGGRAVEMTDEEKGATWWHHASTGGGALLDYCCYGACLARWYVGQPAVAAYGLKANLLTPFGDADDNAVITVRFPQALAVLEATWTCPDHGIPTGPILYGSEGTMVVHSGARLTIHQGREQPVEEVPLDPLPAGRETLGKEVLHHLETGEPLHETL